MPANPQAHTFTYTTDHIIVYLAIVCRRLVFYFVYSTECRRQFVRNLYFLQFFSGLFLFLVFRRKQPSVINEIVILFIVVHCDTGKTAHARTIHIDSYALNALHIDMMKVFHR